MIQLHGLYNLHSLYGCLAQQPPADSDILDGAEVFVGCDSYGAAGGLCATIAVNLTKIFPGK